MTTINVRDVVWGVRCFWGVHGRVGVLWSGLPGRGCMVGVVRSQTFLTSDESVVVVA